jgi:hypothetical protein
MRFQMMIFTAVLCLAAIAAVGAPPLLTGSECDNSIGPVVTTWNSPPITGATDYIGLPDPIGTTWYDYQHNGSQSRMIAVGTDGSIHCCWTNGLNSSASLRKIYYNKKLPSGSWQYPSTGVQVNAVDRTGYCTLDLDPSNNPVISYHGYYTAPEPNHGYVWNSTGEHALPAPPAPTVEIAWPHTCVDSHGYIHVIAFANNVSGTVSGNLKYTRSQNGGTTWTPWQLVDSLGTAAAVGYTLTADPVSGKVAMGWIKPLSNLVMQGEIYYIESSDGVTWNFANKVNMTNFGTGGHPATADSRCYDDMSLLYDHAGNLHASYTTVQYPTATNGGKIWHWSTATGHRFVTGTYVANAWTTLNAPGAWRRSIDRSSLGESAANTLYIQWGQCTTPGDVSSNASAYGNWDVWATYSLNGGHDWKAPVNVTATATPGGLPGACLSENWANMAKKVTTKLNVLYIKDLDAGGIPQSEGTWQLDPVIYQGVPVDSILTGLTVDVTPTGSTTVPPGGGSVPYTLVISNTGTRVLHLDAWIDLQLPNLSIQPVLSRLALTLPPGAAITRSLSQSVPGSAPAGTYSQRLHTGDMAWNNVYAEDSFPFTKTAVDAAGGGTWACSGWDDPVETGIVAPATYLLASVSPNPFNPTTAISYELRAASFVSLKVSDATGRLVATLADGLRDAGTHQVTFDGSNLPSGLYFVRLQAGEFTVTQKLILLK